MKNTARDWASVNREAARLSSSHLMAVEGVRRETELAVEAGMNVAAWEEALALLQGVAAGVQAGVHGRIAAVVTRCLAAVFQDPYSFVIEFEEKRGRTEARMYFTRGGNQFDPRSVGGGVLDVAAFGLRLACLMMTRPPLRKVLVLDEPLRHLSAGNRPRMAALMETLSQEMGVQIIMVTHDEGFKIGDIVEIRK